jgi:hypothetical protein
MLVMLLTRTKRANIAVAPETNDRESSCARAHERASTLPTMGEVLIDATARLRLVDKHEHRTASRPLRRIRSHRSRSDRLWLRVAALARLP